MIGDALPHLHSVKLGRGRGGRLAWGLGGASLCIIFRFVYDGALALEGELGKGEIGLITVLDHTSYVAVKKSKVKNVLSLIRSERIKGKKLKIEVSM